MTFPTRTGEELAQFFCGVKEKREKY